MNIKAIYLLFTAIFIFNNDGMCQGEAIPAGIADTLQDGEQRAERLYNQSIDFIQRGLPDSALRALNEALSIRPDFAPALYNRGVIEFRIQKYKPALDDLTKSISIQHDGQAFYARAQTRMALNDLHGAGEDFTKAIENRPDYPEAHYYRGGIYFIQAFYPQAIADYTEAIRLKGDYAYAYHDQGCAHMKLGDLSQAQDDFLSAVRINPSLYVSFDKLGEVKMMQGDYDGAVKAFTTASGINPDDLASHDLCGIARIYMGDYQGAIDEFDKVLKINPGHIQALNNRGNAKYKMNDYAGAVEDYNVLLRAQPENGTAYLNRGIAREMLRDNQGACDDWQKAATYGIEAAKSYLTDCKN